MVVAKDVRVGRGSGSDGGGSFDGDHLMEAVGRW